MCEHRTCVEPGHSKTDAREDEPDCVWQTHAKGDDRYENSHAEESNGVGESGVHYSIVAQLGSLRFTVAAALRITVDAAIDCVHRVHNGVYADMISLRLARGLPLAKIPVR
ncbi:hypothetical protein [Bradyrhizobium sp. McL0616]|uniref:hypothetical protein n=1 Tax=Bradyrhizobium sp. McL0616 TaxID=3415674 RepID=UPI003CF1C8C4